MDGLKLLPGHFGPDAQHRLIGQIAAIIGSAPLFTPVMPRTGKPFSVRMTNCGALGWVSDQAGGYRYQDRHPETGKPWPAMPEELVDLWRGLTDAPRADACLINYYRPGARMGLHRDSDEQNFSAPVISISLGDRCLFRIGGTARTDPTRSFRLASGDVVVLGGPARLAYHGVDRIHSGSSRLLAGHADVFDGGGRVNLTLRRAR